MHTNLCVYVFGLQNLPISFLFIFLSCDTSHPKRETTAKHDLLKEHVSFQGVSCAPFFSHFLTVSSHIAQDQAASDNALFDEQMEYQRAMPMDVTAGTRKVSSVYVLVSVCMYV